MLCANVERGRYDGFHVMSRLDLLFIVVRQASLCSGNANVPDLPGLGAAPVLRVVG